MVSAMLKEIELSAIDPGNEQEYIETIYFGGGTPSRLSAEEIIDFLNAVRRKYNVSKNAEITIEANPDDINQEILLKWKNAGINRLSLGLQSFYDADLLWMNRAHNAAQAIHSIELIKAAGFQNFSVDLIYGTPTLSDNDWKNNIEKIILLQVPHISCYALTVEPGTALHKMIALKKLQKVDSEKAASQFLILMQMMDKYGYEHYEISNFAKPGFRSRHNTGYWQQKKYSGIGPSAHSFDGASRRWNASNNSLYIQSLQKNIIPFEEEHLTDTNRLNEYIMTSLRTMEGLDLKIVEEKFSAAQRKRIENKIVKYSNDGKIIFNKEKIILTDKGKLFADGIAADLFFDNI